MIYRFLRVVGVISSECDSPNSCQSDICQMDICSCQNTFRIWASGVSRLHQVPNGLKALIIYSSSLRFLVAINCGYEFAFYWNWYINSFSLYDLDGNFNLIFIKI